MEDRSVREADAGEIGREHVVALRARAALDPRHQIVERLLAHLAVERAVPPATHHALHE